MQGIAVFQGKLKGSYVSFYQDNSQMPVKINVHIKNVTQENMGFIFMKKETY